MPGILSCLYLLIILKIEEEESHVFQITLYHHKSFSLSLFPVPSKPNLSAGYDTTI